MYQIERAICNFWNPSLQRPAALNYPSMSPSNEQADFHHFEAKLQQELAASKWQDLRAILAVSGGADSVAMLRSFVALRPDDGIGDLHVVHINHGWRGEHSDGDQQFVVDLCERWNIECHCIGVSTGRGTEEEARNQRYQVFREKACELGARYVLTAHTQDDQVETLIDRIFRGTGLSGLQGIPRTRKLDLGITLLRPMLSHRREEVINYLEDLGQDYRQDSSNQTLDYKRNRIRNELLPLLKLHYHSEADQAVLRLKEMASELFEYLSTDAKNLVEQALVSCGNKQITLDCRCFAGVASVVVREALLEVWQQAKWPRQGMTRSHWLQLEAIVLSASEAVMFPGSIRAEKNGEQLSLTRR